ncbi:MAG: sodium/hydrogen exchanger [Candidatus Berkelbacteria bacterium Licking1014_7]|uniref:Sodium/hydrogen exchanger n=1 Tax=Candidatus Berkelbacteria bacterium Licking1014_7 TaxID=2017147 RepID=A0A554LKL2_9BACT|nr:MAG: sodium/hydrogen exchanger [Candidatus Berkelbacteria bacterium Licking1014_7]
MELIVDLGVIFIAAAISGVILRLFNLPLIVAYILAGIFLGANFLGIITDKEIIENLSSLGVALMLFMVGLELSWSKIKQFSKQAIIIGIGQIIATGLVGYFLALSFGYQTIIGFYIALIFAFSSTVIVVKLLSDRRDINSLYGKISIGVLMIQDLVAIVALIFLYGSQDLNNISATQTLALNIVKVFMLVILIYVFKQKLLPIIFKRMAHSTELLLIASIGWAFIMAISSYILGFGLEIGAFLAGVALASLPYRLEISAQTKSLRDFFITLFFVTLGLNVVFDFSQWNLAQIVIWILFIIVGQTLIVMILMGALGYRRRTSFQTAITLAQVSEFSFLIIAIAVSREIITKTLGSELTIIGIISIIISTILIEHIDNIYYRLAKFLKIFEKSSGIMAEDKIKIPAELTDHVIVFGADHIGKQVLESLQKIKHNMLVVDFNPDVIKILSEAGIPSIYGDMGDPEFINALGLERASMIISTTHDFHDNLQLVKKISQVNKNSIIFVMANTPEEAIELYRAGAERVILPSTLVSDLYKEIIINFKKRKRFNIQKEIKTLKQLHQKFFK